jgi:hypothetical protein
MPKVSIEHATQLAPKDAFQKIKTFFETDQDIRRFDPNIKCDFSEAQLSGKATGSQFKANIAVTGQGQGSKIDVSVDLPLLLAPFKGKVQETIQKKLSKYFA